MWYVRVHERITRIKQSHPKKKKKKTKKKLEGAEEKNRNGRKHTKGNRRSSEG